ncbi:MAG: hypothetical protein KGH99_08170, partial [Thaumarchaeota archaeon]|nr:hypothetical protein [Nitrososphaerota archaeon]
YNLKDQASCMEMTGTWKSITLTCAIDGLQLSSGDKLAIDSGMHLENIGVITNNGGTIYNYGSIFEDEFSVIYNNYGGLIYNYNGIITNSGGTINNYDPIYNHNGVIANYGTVYNYNTIYNYNGSTIDNRYGMIYNNNGTINNDCDSIFEGLAPNGKQVRNICSTIQPSLPLTLSRLTQSGATTQSPLKQFKSGITAKDVKCNDGFQLMIKNENGEPTCVKPESVNKLVNRGWGMPLHGLPMP